MRDRRAKSRPRRRVESPRPVVCVGAGRVSEVEILRRRALSGTRFLSLEQITARNRYREGFSSKPYTVEVVHRPGTDSVACVLYFRKPKLPARAKTKSIFVGVRRAFRASILSRRFRPLAAAERPRAWVYEAVAGSVEPGDRGWRGLRRRMSREIREETGLPVSPSTLERLGAGFFPSHGQSTEKIHLFCAEIPPQPRIVRAPATERGEEGASLHFFELNRAIALCARGTFEDPKLEIGFRRLEEKLLRSRSK
jgi:8-oxo-dGTP pyrophosphatase MutT (NUDIX family)